MVGVDVAVDADNRKLYLLEESADDDVFRSKAFTRCCTFEL